MPALPDLFDQSNIRGPIALVMLVIFEASMCDCFVAFMRTPDTAPKLRAWDGIEAQADANRQESSGDFSYTCLNRVAAHLGWSKDARYLLNYTSSVAAFHLLATSHNDALLPSSCLASASVSAPRPLKPFGQVLSLIGPSKMSSQVFLDQSMSCISCCA